MILLKVLNTLLSNLNVSKCLKFEHLAKNMSDRFLKRIVKYSSNPSILTITDVCHKNPILLFPFFR